MWLWIVLVVLAVMAALLIYAACCVDGDIDRQSEAHPPKLYYSSGVNVEDMIRVMSAVSAKMAAERGIKRVPLAVLSQSEISRRMSAI